MPKETDVEKLSRVMLGEFKRVHKRFDAIDRRFDALEQRVTNIETELRDIRERLEALEEASRISSGVGHAFDLVDTQN
jgi:predicted  nucleic acid-binding Zn-ribbon protein